MLGNQQFSPTNHSRAMARCTGKRNTAAGCTCRGLLGFALFVPDFKHCRRPLSPGSSRTLKPSIRSTQPTITTRGGLNHIFRLRRPPITMAFNPRPKNQPVKSGCSPNFIQPACRLGRAHDCGDGVLFTHVVHRSPVCSVLLRRNPTYAWQAAAFAGLLDFR